MSKSEAEEMEEGVDEVDKDQLESLLNSDLLKINDLRDIIKDRDLNVTGRSNEKLISAILSDKWTKAEFDELKEDISLKQEELGPKGFYIQSIDSIDWFTERPRHEEIEERLKSEEAVIEDSNIVEDGFEITSISEDAIEGVYWSQNTKYVLGPFNQLRSRESLYDTEFIIDLENDLVLIGADQFGKARSFSSALGSMSMELGPVGHRRLSSSQANDYVDSFVDDLKESLSSENDDSQTGMEEFSNSETSDLDSTLKIDMVNVEVESGDVEKVRVGGRSDIYGIDTVEDLKENKEGKISQIKGELLFKDHFFNCTVGYNQIAGRVMVKKKSGADGDVQVVQNAYDLVYDLYKQYFVDI